jgi:hypothetical protein
MTPVPCPKQAAALLLAGLATVLAARATAATLYDASLGSKPSSQGWTPLVLGTPGSETVAGGLYNLDTTGPGVVYDGNYLVSAMPLDTAAGFQLSFNLAVLSETHTDATRSGFSVVVVGNDPTHEIELAFWGDHVWTYDYTGGAFVHGADVALDTSVLRNYSLSVSGQQYTLSADGTLLLSGSLKDYTAAGLVYTTPNFIFFGDDSSRGTSSTQVGLITLSLVPEPAAAWLWLSGLTALALPGRRRQRAASNS